MPHLPSSQRRTKGNDSAGKSSGKRKAPTAAVVAHNALKITKQASQGTRKRMGKAASDARQAVGGAIKKVGSAVAGDAAAGKRSSGKSKGFGGPMAIPPAGGTTTRKHGSKYDEVSSHKKKMK